MTSKFTELAIDCSDPNGLARFWCSVLDYEVQDEDDGIVTIGSPMVPEGKNHLGPVPPTLTFAHVPEGKTVKNRLHLDLNPTDREQDEEVRRLLDLGARHADVGQGDVSWVVLADPEGMVRKGPSVELGVRGRMRGWRWSGSRSSWTPPIPSRSAAGGRTPWTGWWSTTTWRSS